MTARNAICRTSMSLLSNPVPRTDRKKSSNESSPTQHIIYNPRAEDGTVTVQSRPLEGAMCNFRAHLIEKLADVRFSNRPFGVKHFQTIHHCSIAFAHGLALLFGIGTKALPSWDSRTRWNNLWVGVAVRRTAGPSGHANSPHPSSREGHHSTASLIGRLGSSTFRLSTTAVSMSLTGSRFSSEPAPRPFHHGIRGRGGTIFGSALPSALP